MRRSAALFPFDRPGLYTVSAFCFAVLSACDALTPTWERDPNDVPLKEIIEVTSSTSLLRAKDTTTMARLQARIPKEATSREITFSTTAGTFHPFGIKEYKVIATPDSTRDNRLAATAILRSDTIAGVALVSASIAGFRDTTRITILP